MQINADWSLYIIYKGSIYCHTFGHFNICFVFPSHWNICPTLTSQLSTRADKLYFHSIGRNIQVRADPLQIRLCVRFVKLHGGITDCVSGTLLYHTTGRKAGRRTNRYKTLLQRSDNAIIVWCGKNVTSLCFPFYHCQTCATNALQRGAAALHLPVGV